MSRPTLLSTAMGGSICARISEGRSLRSVCSDADMPDKSTVLRWLADPLNAEFRDQYACAREAMADSLFDELLEIADDGTNDHTTREVDGREVEVVDHEHIQRSKLRVDARKWMLSKLNPKRYGEKLELGGKVALSHEDALKELE